MLTISPDTRLGQDRYLDWMRGGNAALFLGTGLGKGAIAAMYLHEYLAANPHARVLITAPAGLVADWRHKLREYAGIVATQWGAKSQTDVRLISHDRLVLPKPGGKSGNRKNVVKDILAWGPQAVFVDEAHNFASYKARRTKGLLKVGACPATEQRFIFTGTPITQADDCECLRPQLLFLAPHVLERHGVVKWPEWRGKLVSTRRRFGREEATGVKNLALLHQVLDEARCVFNKGEHLKCPEVFEPAYFQLAPKTRRIYDRLAAEGALLEGGFEVVSDNALTRALHLRNLRSGFVRSGDAAVEVGSEALDATADLVCGLGEPCVVYYQFSLFGSRLHEVLTRRRIRAALWNGQTPPQRKKDLETAFQAGEFDVIVAQAASIAEGWTLTRARHAVFAEPTYELVQWEQLLGRINRRGQTGTCFYHLVTGEDTPDEQAYTALRKKIDFADLIHKGAAASSRSPNEFSPPRPSTT